MRRRPPDLLSLNQRKRLLSEIDQLKRIQAEGTKYLEKITQDYRNELEAEFKDFKSSFLLSIESDRKAAEIAKAELQATLARNKALQKGLLDRQSECEQKELALKNDRTAFIVERGDFISGLKAKTQDTDEKYKYYQARIAEIDKQIKEYKALTTGMLEKTSKLADKEKTASERLTFAQARIEFAESRITEMKKRQNIINNTSDALNKKYTFLKKIKVIEKREREAGDKLKTIAIRTAEIKAQNELIRLRMQELKAEERRINALDKRVQNKILMLKQMGVTDA